MQLPPVRQSGTLIKRYKRFLADIALTDGTTITVHCPNSGSMKGCSTPGSQVIISKSDNLQRKYAWTLEMIQVNNIWIGINTSLTNRLVREALENGTIDDFGRVVSLQQEVKVSDKSRLDFLVQTHTGPVYIEVKNCSMVEEKKAMFPDAVTVRGTKHLRELERLKKNDVRTAILFCIQRSDGHCFRPAHEIDPVYADTLYEVRQNNVEILPYRSMVKPDSVTITDKLPLCEEFL